MFEKYLDNFYPWEITKSKKLRHAVSFPFITIVIVPLLFLDIVLELYHHICFPLYNIPLVKRENYIRMDRHKLSYLGPAEKVFCAYCGYANGLIHYAQVIAGETEKYWCAIKHQKYHGFVPPTHHKDFADYGDELGYKEQRTRLK